MFLVIERGLCSENNPKAAAEITVVPNSSVVAICRHYLPTLVLQILIFRGLYLCIGNFYENCLALIYPETFKFKSKFLEYINGEVAGNEVSKSNL